MWWDGDFVNYCDPARASRPLPAPGKDNITVDDTTDNTAGFSKGYGGRYYHTCTGVDPGCPEWYESPVGIGSHTYRLTADGNGVEDNWAKWQLFSQPANYTRMYEAQVYSPSISGYVHCYQSNGDDPCLYLPPIYIAPYRFTWISPSLSVASAFIKSYTKLAIEVDEWNSTLGKLQSYMGLGTHPELQPGYFGTSTAYLPYLPSGWANGIQVQNMSQNPSHIHVTVNGQLLYDNSVAGHGWVNVTTYTGSEGMVQSVDGYPLLVEVDNYRNITGDWLMSYMGVNR